jgi:5-methylcytosine-specific restriction protein A
MADWPYNSARWKRLRAEQLATFPLCEGCKPRIVPANHVDHRRAISDGGEPFPPVGTGLASLCASCHSIKTVRGPEHGALQTTKPRRGCDAAGRPLDPSHPWHST